MEITLKQNLPVTELTGRIICHYSKTIKSLKGVEQPSLSPDFHLEEGIWFRTNHLEGSGALGSLQRALGY